MDTIIGTIKHNTEARRVELWMDGEGRIWADRDAPHIAHDDRASDAVHANRIARKAWGGPEWNFVAAKASAYIIVDKATGEQYRSDRNGYRHNEYRSEYDARQAIEAMPAQWRGRYEVRSLDAN